MPFYGIKSPAKRLDCHATGLLSEDIFQQSSGQPFWRATKDRRNSNKLEVKRVIEPSFYWMLWRTISPAVIKMTSSAILVLRSPIRSKFAEIVA